MLFSGSTPNKPKREDKRERKADKEDKTEVQEAVFTRWANSLFEDSITELRDIVELDFLQAFVKLIIGHNAQVTGNRFDDIDSVFHALCEDEEDKIFQLSIPELCEGNIKPLLTLCWQFIQIFWRRFAPQDGGERKLAEAIADWVKEATNNHPEVMVNDFISSFRDGMALNLLLYSYDDSLVNLDKIREMRGDERIENALSLGKKYFKTPKLIQAREFHSEYLDKKSVVTYLMSLYIGMAYHSSSLSSSSKKSTRSNPDPEQLQEELSHSQHHKHHQHRLEPPPPAQHNLSVIDEFTGSPNTSSISIQSSTHSSAPSSSTTTTVIQGGIMGDVPLHQSTETLSEVNQELMQEEEQSTSRRSSSSSQRSSSKSRKSAHRNERLLKEYELCLEQVLTWLLEAEDEMSKMEPVNEVNVDTVKQQFKEHEQFMIQLTSSQGSVGRVLHAGQNLSQKLPEDQASSITQQLVIVNQKWDTLREKAMLRQQALQEQLNRLQRDQLHAICDWIQNFEQIIAEHALLADTAESCKQQILNHTQIQEQIEHEQASVQKLSTFMAVVDEHDGTTDTQQAYNELESLLQDVGKRWVKICEWAERRSHNLDGLVELLENYDNLHTHLSAWLNARQEELTRLRSVHHLESDQEIEEQKKLIHEMDEILGKEHSKFMELSKLCNDLVQRFDSENMPAAARIRKQFDSLSQNWENIVTRLEEHSQMLSRAHKDSTSKSEKEPEKESTESSSQPNTAQASFDTTSDPESKRHQPSNETVNLVDKFIGDVKQLESKIQPIYEFLRRFKISEYRSMEKEFKQNFETVLKAKADVESLNVQISRIHESSVDSEQLHSVNENYDHLMHIYERVVSRFTQQIQLLQNPQLVNDETAQIESRLLEWIKSANAVWNELIQLSPEQRGRRLDDFSNQLLEQQKNLADLKQANPNSERFRPLEGQLIELIQKVRREREKERNATVEKQKRQESGEDSSIKSPVIEIHENTPRPSIEEPLSGGESSSIHGLSKQADSIRRRLEGDEGTPLADEPRTLLQVPQADDLQAWLAAKEHELKRASGEITPGDLEAMHKNNEIYVALLRECSDRKQTAKDAEDRRAVDNLQKFVETKREQLNEQIQRAEIAVHKCVLAEEIADNHKRQLDTLKNSNIELHALQQQLSKLSDAFHKSLPSKNEAINQLDELMSACSKSKSDRREKVTKSLRDRGQKLDTQWSDLESDIDEFRSLTAKENRKRIQAIIRNQTQLVDELKEGIKMSGDATDAEELSEHVDNMERLLDKITNGQKEGSDPFAEFKATNIEDTLIAGEVEKLRSTREQVIDEARRRCSRLQSAINKCEEYEGTLCNFQSWCQNMHHILNARLADDLAALDIPQEYKKMDTEFNEYERLMRELSAFIQESASHWASCDRLKLQLDHAQSQLAELKTKFETFKHPIQFSKQLEKMERDLSEVENFLDDLTSVRAENCEYCLQHACQLLKQLTDLAVEFVGLESGKDALVQASIFNEQQALETSRRLEAAQEKCTLLSNRSNDACVNLEYCLKLLDKFKAESSNVEQLLQQIEALVPENADLSQAEPEVRQSLTDKIDRCTLSAQKALELQDLLHQNFVKVDENQLGAVEGRLSALRRQLGVQQRSDEDQTSASEKLFDKVRSVVEKLENSKSTQSLNDALKKYAPLKQQMDEQAARLIKQRGSDPDTQNSQLALVAVDLLSRWANLERKAREQPKSPPKSDDNAAGENVSKEASPDDSARLPPAIDHDAELLPVVGEDFGKSVNNWVIALKNANSTLDFIEYPSTDSANWKQRIESVDAWHTNAKKPLDDLLMEGKQLANTGRMELQVHEVLDRLDAVMNLSAKINSDLEDEKALYKQSNEFENSVRKNHAEIMQQLNQIQPGKPQSNEHLLESRTKLMETESRLQVLSYSAEELKRKLPGRECALDSSISLLDEINRHMNEIEEQVQKALINALSSQQRGNQQTAEDQLTDDEINRIKVLRAPDGQSISSGAGLSLAMDVQETEGEESEDAQRRYAQPVGQPLISNSLDQFYVELDTMEDYMDTPEKLHYDGLTEKLQMLKSMEQQLDLGEELVQCQQMTMDINECEHTLQRISNLRKLILARRQELSARGDTINTLNQLFNQAEELVAKVVHCLDQQNKARDSQGRIRSPELDEIEGSQLEMENLLPPTAALLQQCSNRLANISEHLATAESEILQQRLADMENDFRIYSNDVRERRKTLEDRLSEQNYLTNQLDLLEFWCDEAEVNMHGRATFLDPNGLEMFLKRVQSCLNDVEEKFETFRNLETLKDRFVALANVEDSVKHEIRRNVTQLGKRISDLHIEMTHKLKELTDAKELSDDFWERVENEERWIDEAEKQAQAVSEARLYRPLLLNLEQLITDSAEKRFLVDSLQRQVAEEALEFEHADEHKASMKRVKQLSKKLEAVTSKIREVLKNAENCAENITQDVNVVINQEEPPQQQLSIKQMEQSFPVDQTSYHFDGQPQDDNLSTEYESLTTRNGSIPSVFGEASGEPPKRPPHKQRPPNFQYEVHSPSQHDSLYTGLNEQYVTDNEQDKRSLPRRANSEEQARLETVVRLKAWLQEVERDAATNVDLADQQKIRQTASKVQNLLDEMTTHRMEVGRIVDISDDKLVVERAVQCAQEMDRLLHSCQRRKNELNEMLHQSKMWDNVRSEVELWLNDGNDRLTNGPKVNEMNEVTLGLELRAVNGLVDGLEHTKQQISALNSQSNKLLDLYTRDDSHTLSHMTSKINTQWTKFNDNVRIRRAVLEASLKARSDIQSTLAQLQQWLDKQLTDMRQLHEDTDNNQRLKDTTKRRDWMAIERETKAEIDAHGDVYESVREMCRKLLMSLDANKNNLHGIHKNLEQVENKWDELVRLDNEVRERLENAQEECERLTRNLAELLHWTDMQISTILHDQPVGGDLGAIQRQNETVKTIERQFEVKDREVNSCIQLAHSFLMQHDLRPVIHRQSVLEPADNLPKSETQLEERRVGVQILADSGKLKSTYETLKQHVNAWQKVVISAHKDIRELDQAIAESFLAIGTIENELEAQCPVENLRLEELKEVRLDNAKLKRKVNDAAIQIDDVNDCTGQIAAQNIVLSPNMEAQIHTVNQRYEKLKKEVAIRSAALERAFADFGPSSEHFLGLSVNPPWQRSISAVNKLPYYIDHQTETSSWDHPLFMNILENLCTFNQVKFSAYRTAMKLRALQKHLLFDLVSLASVDDTLRRFHGFKLDDRISIEDTVSALVPLFEEVHEHYPNLVRNVPMAVDLALNLMLNIYDPCRDGKMRIISFAVALVTLCNATLESKYKFLFSLISDDEGVTHKKLGLLFYDLIYIPKFLGESAVFGGSNVEPSVRSCFEHNKYPEHLSVDGYLDWLRKEPQNLIWLIVMHRLQSSEFAKHSSKCSTCKMFPIVGMRYRCLRCFNFDICQNCFFSQRTAKSHKLTHPMQEYCLPTNTIDDVRDFTLIVKNKVRRARSKIGYLPVETVDEGVSLEQGQTAPQNPNSETIHHRIQQFSSRLHNRHLEMGSAPKGEEKKVSIGPIIKNRSLSPQPQSPVQARKSLEHDRQRSSDIKSPSQLITQVEQMHKEELDQLLQKLQQENGELKQAVDRKRRLGSTPNLESGRMPMRQMMGTEMNGNALHRQYQQPGLYASAQTMPYLATSKPSLYNGQTANTQNDPTNRQWTAEPANFRHISQPTLFSNAPNYGRSFPSLPRGYSEIEALAGDKRRLLEAQSLRQHQKHLEERGRMLEDQNKQLQLQLERLQKMVHKQESTGNLNLDGSPMDNDFYTGGGWSTLPSRGRSDFNDLQGLQGLSSEDEVPGGLEGLTVRKNRMNALISTVNELNTAMESFVVSVVSDEARDRDRVSESESKEDQVEEDKNGAVTTTNGVH